MAQYASLFPDDKIALLENGVCPPGGLAGSLPECDPLEFNFAVDWELLRPALGIAFNSMHHKETHILDEEY